ncbi:MAG: 3-dehydroquinate synthase, partial [Gammaproteobacteria bacterium]|nr:3-dehydroquinate synthase [Gammaproteobacteria bacterium]
DSMAIDKKTIDGAINLVLLRKLGEACISGDYDHDKLLQTLAI